MIFGLAFLGILYLIFLRRRHDRRNKIKRKFIKRFQPVVIGAASGADYELPPVDEVDDILILELWFKAASTVNNEGQSQLEDLAQRLNLVDRAERILQTSSRVDELSCAQGVLVELLSVEHIKPIRDNLDSNNSILSLSAASALLKLAPEKYMSEILQEIGSREGWPEARVASILEGVDSDLYVETFRSRIDSLDPENTGRLIKFLVHLAPARSLEIIQSLLEADRDAEEVAACLRGAYELGHPALAKYAREYLGHGQFFVRAQAAEAMARLGEKEDKELLVERLGDKNWWVRYRAARSLLELPGVKKEELKRLQRELSDRFGRQILAQVLEEEEI